MVRSLNRDKVERAVRDGRMLTLTTHAYFAEERDYMDQILYYFLETAGRPDLHDRLSYCIHELANNAKKANTKRVYFAEKGLDIDNESQYWVGMRTFNAETVRHIDHYLERLKESKLFIRVQFTLKAGELRITVRNNVRLTRVEREKMEEKIARSRIYDSVADAYASIEDTSEGAGLGIVMMFILLRNLGLSEKAIRFYANDRETYVRLSVPLAEAPIDNDPAQV